MKKIFDKLKNYIYNITHPCLKNSLRWGNLTMGCMFILTKTFYDKGLFLFIFLLDMLFLCQWLYMFIYVSELKEDN